MKYRIVEMVEKHIDNHFPKCENRTYYVIHFQVPLPYSWLTLEYFGCFGKNRYPYRFNTVEDAKEFLKEYNKIIPPPKVLEEIYK